MDVKWLCPCCGGSHEPPCLLTPEEIEAYRAQKKRAIDVAMHAALLRSSGVHPRVLAIRANAAKAPLDVKG